MLPTHINSTGADPSPGVARQLRQELEVLGHQVKAGVTELLDSPVVDERIQGWFEVADPQQPRADLEKVLPVVEGVIEGGQQAVGGERSPACGEDWEQNEDRGEGTCFEAHVNVHLKGPLQTHQTQLAGLAEAHRVRVGVDAQRVVPERTQDAHERVQHHQEWYKEEHQHNEHHVSMVATLNRVAKNTLRCSGGNVQGWMANGKWEGKAERQRPRDRDQHFGPAWTKFVLLLHDD